MKNRPPRQITTPTNAGFRDFKFIINGKEVTYWSYRTKENRMLKEVPAYNVETSIRLILPHIKDVNHQDLDGKTALIHLMENYESSDEEQLIRCLSLFMKAGADPGITDLMGVSACDIAEGKVKDFLLDH